MKKVAAYLQVPPSARHTIHAQAEALARKILPDMAENDIVACLAAGVEADEPFLFSDESACKGLDGVMNGDEREECNNIKNDSMKAKLKRTVLSEYLKATGRQMPAVKTVCSGLLQEEVKLTYVDPSAAPEVSKLAREGKTQSHLHQLPQGVKAWLPQGVVGCSLALGHGRSYCVRCPREVPPRSRAVTWAAEGCPGLSRLDALRSCIRWVWLAHTEANPKETMPFELQAIRL